MFLALDGSVSTESRCGEALGNQAPRQRPLSAMSSGLVSAALPGCLGKGEKQRDTANSGGLLKATTVLESVKQPR